MLLTSILHNLASSNCFFLPSPNAVQMEQASTRASKSAAACKARSLAPLAFRRSLPCNLFLNEARVHFSPETCTIKECIVAFFSIGAHNCHSGTRNTAGPRYRSQCYRDTWLYETAKKCRFGNPMFALLATLHTRGMATRDSQLLRALLVLLSKQHNA